MEYCLVTDGLCKRYRKAAALDQLNMHIPKGAIYGFVGKNGAGKTTLIRLISGLSEPTAGDYRLYGISYKDKEIFRVRKRIGAVIERPSLYQNMTAEANLMQQFQILGVPSYETIPQLLQLVGLSDVGKKKVRDYSLGMKQRLGIALALCGNPDFILLDEPINGLDPQGIIDIREIILKLNREENITFLISSHILGELAKLATHFGFIDNGRMLKEMSMEELRAVCRKCVRIEVTELKKLILVLDVMKLDYKIISDSSADIFDYVSVTQIVMKLAEEGCDVISMQERDENLESFYLNLVGGESHA